MSEVCITLDNLAVGYDGRAVLSGISLPVAFGSFTALLGANGSGKSTLLKTILGLLPPVSGRMQIASSAIFGYVPQAVAFDPLYPLTGFDVALMGVYRRVPPARRIPRSEREFVRECLHATGAETFADGRFSELSGGQKQRVLIARALATQANVLVLDEPTAGVDAAAKHTLLEFISQLHRSRELTILLVTHDLPLVRKHAQQVVWLHEDHILQGTAEELLAPEHVAEILELEVG